MHNAHIFIVKAANAELAISKVNTELELDERLTSDNYFSINGAVDLVQNSFTPYDTDRTWDNLHSIEGISKEVNECIAPERYAGLKEQLKLSVEKERWFDVERLAKSLDGISYAVNKGSVFSADNIIRFNEDDYFDFGVSDWTGFSNDKEDNRVFAVIVDFHS